MSEQRTIKDIWKEVIKEWIKLEKLLTEIDREIKKMKL